MKVSITKSKKTFSNSDKSWLDFLKAFKLKKLAIQLSIKSNNACKFILPSANQHRAWWVKISTAQPKCIYYFGSFTNRQEAKNSYWEYIEDLTAEKTIGITVEIIYCTQPENLTIFEENV